MVLLYTIGFFLLLFIVVFLDLLLFGSSVDPDDNGLLRTPSQKEKFKLLKLNKRKWFTFKLVESQVNKRFKS